VSGDAVPRSSITLRTSILPLPVGAFWAFQGLVEVPALEQGETPSCSFVSVKGPSVTIGFPPLASRSVLASLGGLSGSQVISALAPAPPS
jgi:hypothetical protein